MSWEQFYLFKDFQFEQIQISYHKKSTAHCVWRNADLNLILVVTQTNGLTFFFSNNQFIDGIYRACLTWLDCNTQLSINCFSFADMLSSQIQVPDIRANFYIPAGGHKPAT